MHKFLKTLLVTAAPFAANAQTGTPQPGTIDSSFANGLKEYHTYTSAYAMGADGKIYVGQGNSQTAKNAIQVFGIDGQDDHIDSVGIPGFEKGTITSMVEHKKGELFVGLSATKTGSANEVHHFTANVVNGMVQSGSVVDHQDRSIAYMQFDKVNNRFIAAGQAADSNAHLTAMDAASYQLVNSYGNQGVVTLPADRTLSATAFRQVNALAVDAQGRAVVGGINSDTAYSPLFERYDANGMKDVTFTPALDSNFENVQTIAMLKDGNMTVGSTGGKQSGVEIRSLDSTGKKRASLPNGGATVTSMGGAFNGVFTGKNLAQIVALDGGRYVTMVMPVDSDTTSLIWHKPDGNPDSSCGTNGLTQQRNGLGINQTFGAALQPKTGKLLTLRNYDNFLGYSGNSFGNRYHTGVDTNTLSVKKLNAMKQNGLKLYPNPAPNKFTVQNDNAGDDEQNVQMFDLKGQKVLDTKVQFKKNQKEMETDLPTGTYMFLLQSKEGVHVEKLVIGQ